MPTFRLCDAERQSWPLPPDPVFIGRRPASAHAPAPDGRRVQGSLAIARALEELVPDPSLYPSQPAARATADEAERWGESVLQPVPRRLVRWGLGRHLSQRRWFADVGSPLPAPGLTAVLLTPIVPVFVRQVGASDERVLDIATGPGYMAEAFARAAREVIGVDLTEAMLAIARGKRRWRRDCRLAVPALPRARCPVQLGRALRFLVSGDGKCECRRQRI